MKLKRLNHVWLLVFAAAVVLGVQYIVMNTFGVFLVPLTEQFDLGRGVVSGALSMCLLLMGFLGIFTGGLSDKYGPRPLVAVGGALIVIGLLITSSANSLWQVYLGWGFFMGVGGSCCLTPVFSSIPRWFHEKRGLVLGITTAGMGVCGILFPLLAQLIISSGGWRQSAVVLGLISIIVIPLSYFLKRKPGDTKLSSYGGNLNGQSGPPASLGSGFSLKQAIKTGRFWFWAPVHACFLFCMQAVTAHVVSYSIDMGTTAIAAASIVSIILGSSIIGNLAIGFLSDKIGGKAAFSACLILGMAALAWLLFAREIWMFYLFAVVFGLVVGGTNPLTTVVSAELFGLKSLGAIYGGVMLVGTIGGSLGATLTGAIFDITESYTIAFSICIALTAVAVILSLMLLRYKVELAEAKS